MNWLVNGRQYADQSPEGYLIGRQGDQCCTIILGVVAFWHKASGNGTTTGWAESASTPGPHTHPEEDVTDLITDLAALAAAIAGCAPLIHSHILSEIPSSSDIMDALGASVGAIPRRASAGWGVVNPGTSGHVLTSNGPGSEPTYQAAPGGSASATTVEVDLGSSSVFRGKFTITDAAITAAKKVLCWQAPGPYTGKGTRADEAEMQPVQVIAVEPAAGSAVVKWQTPPMLAESPLETRSPNFGNGTAANSGTNRDVQTRARRLGRVRGSVKFSYAIFT